MPALSDLSAEELVARGIAPIKTEYRLSYISRKQVETFAGSAVTATGSAEGSKKKSKKQQKKERADSAKADLCSNFVLGNCIYGDKCRFSHDTETYLARKLPDLHGCCPFSLQERCPYGISCRWACSHKAAQQGGSLATAALAAAPADTAAGTAAANGAAPPLPQTTDGLAAASTALAAPIANMAAAHHSATGGTPVTKGTAVDRQLKAPVAAAAAAIEGAATAAASMDGTPPAEAVEEAAESIAHVAPVSDNIGDHSIPAVVQLPVIQQLQAPINTLPKKLQQQLWKGWYNFNRADAVLAELGRNSSGADNGAGSRNCKNNKQQQQGKLQQQQRQQCSQHHQHLATAPPAAAAARLTADSGTQEPAAKRQKANIAAVVDGNAAMTDTEMAPAVALAAAPISNNADLDALYDTAEFAGTDVPTTAATATAAHMSDVALIASIQNDQQQRQQQQLLGPSHPQQHTAAAAASTGNVAALDALYDTADFANADVAGPEPRRKPRLDFAGKTYLAPLTTVGNLPFRRLCVSLGCEVTCGEMALATNILQGQASEWALLKRHPSERLFGVQVCGGYPDAMSRVAQLVDEQLHIDFIDINCGCPIDIICNRGAGSALLRRPQKLEEVVRATTGCTDLPVIVKIRKGYFDDSDVAHTLIPEMASWGAAAVTLHGRSRQQRYSRAADWDYIRRCAGIAHSVGLPLIGNGDVFSPTEWEERVNPISNNDSSGANGGEQGANVTTAMIGRAALIKPWIFTEIMEQRLWDISASERLDVLKSFVSHGLEHWGSDSRGVETTRRFLLEWLSFTHRYIPVGLLEVVPQKMQWRPPAYSTRNQLEGLLSSDSAADWVRISEMLLGPAPAGFTFTPKHKSNAYTVSTDMLAQIAAVGAGHGAAVQDSAADDDQENG